ncbi:uncharacterized protein UTRI_01144_B [Ustilago trichophora]|uniref:PARP-type domain-containing protein n=1 Tax=Ustilago trichophora TaxID=86804 RepID=A0A5C3DVP8_9BASI|nr:uncharacterized protein UTRI_01144_B [Ustilago trichophora]
MPYRLEYATSSRAGCKGPKPCLGTKILKGELRLGTLVEIQGSQSFSYRHFGCITPKIIRNIQEKEGITDPADLDGFEDLIPEDQARVARAFADGHVASEDIPDSARYAAADEADKVAAEAAVLPPTSSASTEKSAKKRGRPSKASLEAAAPNGASAQPPKDNKKPGRPRKDAAAAGVSPAPVATPDAPAAKKRGRPPKNAAAASTAIPAAPAVPQPAAAAPPQKKRGRPAKASLEDAAAAAAQPAPAPAAPVAPSASAQASPKKRGRPPKDATAAAAAPVAPVPVPATAPAPVPAASAAPAGPPAKKRGRPSKASLEASAAAAATAGNVPFARPPSNVASNGPGLPMGFTFGIFADNPSPPLGWAPAAPTPSPKKRGRPPKNAATAVQPSPSVVPYQAPMAPMAPSTPVAAPSKKRGRPKKNVDPAAANAASLSQVTTPPLPRTAMPLQAPVQASPSVAAASPSSGKKRGRPPKDKVEGEEPVKRPRGRPKKVDDAAAPAPVAVQQPAPVAHPGQTASAAPAKKPRGRPKKNP